MDGILPELDAFSRQILWPRDAMVPRQDKSQRPIHGHMYPDAGRGHHFGNRESVVPHLKRRGRIEQIETVMDWPGESQCQT